MSCAAALPFFGMVVAAFVSNADRISQALHIGNSLRF